MCIAAVCAFYVEGLGFVKIVINNRDQDKSTKCLDFMSLAQVKGRHNIPVNPGDDKVFGLFNDNEFLHSQLMFGNGKLALIVDERLAVDDSRRKITDWGTERGSFCKDFVLGSESAMNFMIKCANVENQRPYKLLLWDIASDTWPSYYYCNGIGILCRLPYNKNKPLMFVVETGSTATFRGVRLQNDLITLVELQKLCNTADIMKAIEQELLPKLIHILQDTTKPTEDEEDQMLHLGKPFGYESHVESIRIEPRPDISWCTRTSVAIVQTDKGMVSRSVHYSI